MPRDLDVIVRTLDTPDWVFLPPSADRVMQDEVHDDARAEILRRGMDPGTPYAGWHTQADAAGRDGMLTRPQRVYFGGDRQLVRDHLEALEPHGFAVLGGRSDSESFVVVRDAAPSAAVAEQLPALRTRLRLLADAQLLPDAPVPLRAGEGDLLHDVLRSSDLAAEDGAVHPDALLALHRRGLATVEDVDAVVRGWREAFGDRAAELARTAVDLDHPLAEDLLLDLLADGAAPSDLLLAWGDERAVGAARETALRGTRRDVGVFLDLAVAHGTPRREALLGLAEQVRTSAPEEPGHRERLDTLAYLAPSVVTADGTAVSAVLAALQDESLPGWLRAQVATTHATLPIHLRHGIVRTGWGAPRPFGPSPDQPTLAEALAVVDAWDAGARAACAAADAPPWPGFAVGNPRSRAWAHETTTTLLPWQVLALRRHLERAAAPETELATCLELLLVGGELRLEDVAPLRKGWRRRLFVAPDPYSRARPAVVSLAITLLRAGDPLGHEVADVVLADTRAWAAGPRHLLLAETGAPDAAARLWSAAMVDSPGSQQAAQGWVLLDARTHGHPVAVAAARGWSAVTDPGPQWRRNHFLDAALCLADPARPAWGSTSATGSVRQVRAALELAGDPQHPTQMRVRALEAATRSRVLRAPEDAEPVAVGVDVATALRHRAAELGAGLGAS